MTDNEQSADDRRADAIRRAERDDKRAKMPECITGTIWYEVDCICGRTNWVNAGYFPDEDMSKMDVDGFRCWSCDKVNNLAEEFESDYPEDGQEAPRGFEHK